MIVLVPHSLTLPGAAQWGAPQFADAWCACAPYVLLVHGGDGRGDAAALHESKGLLLWDDCSMPECQKSIAILILPVLARNHLHRRMAQSGGTPGLASASCRLAASRASTEMMWQP